MRRLVPEALGDPSDDGVQPWAQATAGDDGCLDLAAGSVNGVGTLSVSQYWGSPFKRKPAGSHPLEGVADSLSFSTRNMDTMK